MKLKKTVNMVMVVSLVAVSGISIFGTSYAKAEAPYVTFSPRHTYYTEHDSVAGLPELTYYSPNGGSTTPQSGVTYSSSNPSVYEINDSQTNVYAHGVGNAILTGTYNGLSTTIPVYSRELTSVTRPAFALAQKYSKMFYYGRVSATLTDRNTGQPISGKTIKFQTDIPSDDTYQDNSPVFCSATTSMAGVASCVGFVLTHGNPGNFAAVFNDDGTYGPSFGETAD